MNPITKYLKNLFASKRVIGDDINLTGLARADAILADLIERKKVPGISITVLEGGKTLMQKGYGFSDIENKIPVHPKKSVFRIASISKNIAATALAIMVEEGKIDLDASFYDYVPYYPKKKWDFTIRQLAGHTAGIRGYRGTEYGLNKPFSIKESIEIFKDDELLFEPGSDYFYNSYDWVLISLAMQEAGKVPFEKYVEEKVLDPLAMKNTFTPYQAEHSRDLTSNEFLTKFYTKNRLGDYREAIVVNNFYKLAGGGYLSTSEDIAKFGRSYLDGILLNEVVRTEFLTSQMVKGKPTYYGLGWQVSEDQKGRKFYGHIGNGVGGYANLFVYPEEQMVFAILTNSTNPDIQDELDKVVDVLISTRKV
ncbi:serine hydrolase domain-containing protein [Maribacter algicola]|uniref:Serine hydrolase domain-containing protein n=1 Tax=Meishania litoralis TaxID=3434685 RepID=A0ACC7LNJ8_9FLAO